MLKCQSSRRHDADCRKKRRSIPRLVVGAIIGLICTGCSSYSGLPKPGTPKYRELVHAFNVGLAGLQSGEDIRAQKNLVLATQIAPGEPASWANLGILATRQQELDAAYADLEKARSLAPSNSRIEQLLGDLESRRGKLPEAIEHLKRAVQLDKNNLKALYLLAEQTEREGTGTSDNEALETFRRVLALSPNNTAVLIEVARLSAKTGNVGVLRDVVADLHLQSVSWPEEAKQQMQALEQAASSTNPRTAALQVAFLRNILLRAPNYRRASQTVKTPAVFVGEPFLHFLKLPSPNVEAAPADLQLTFRSQPATGIGSDGVAWVRSVWLDDSGRPSLLWEDGSGLHVDGDPTLPVPAGRSPSLSPNTIALADLNYDFKNDLVVAADRGIRIYQQETPQHFTDVTTQWHIPTGVLNGSYSGAWPFDIDLDGDLDIILAAKEADPVVLRNNGDSSFGIVRPFAGVKGGAAFAAADIDGDGTPDVAFVGSDGKFAVFMNERFGHFRARTVPKAAAQGVAAVTAGDVDGDGSIDFIIMKSDGSILRLSDEDGGSEWQTAELAKAAAPVAGTASISAADFDNNGRLDLLTGSGEIFLGTARGLSRLPSRLNVTSATAADITGDGRLDITGLAGGRPVVLTNHGTKSYQGK